MIVHRRPQKTTSIWPIWDLRKRGLGKKPAARRFSRVLGFEEAKKDGNFHREKRRERNNIRSRGGGTGISNGRESG